MNPRHRRLTFAAAPCSSSSSSRPPFVETLVGPVLLAGGGARRPAAATVAVGRMESSRRGRNKLRHKSSPPRERPDSRSILPFSPPLPGSVVNKHRRHHHHPDDPLWRWRRRRVLTPSMATGDGRGEQRGEEPRDDDANERGPRRMTTVVPTAVVSSSCCCCGRLNAAAIHPDISRRLAPVVPLNAWSPSDAQAAGNSDVATAGGEVAAG